MARAAKALVFRLGHYAARQMRALLAVSCEAIFIKSHKYALIVRLRIRKRLCLARSNLAYASDFDHTGFAAPFSEEVLKAYPELAYSEGEACQHQKLREVAPRYVMIFGPVNRKIFAPLRLLGVRSSVRRNAYLFVVALDHQSISFRKHRIRKNVERDVFANRLFVHGRSHINVFNSPDAGQHHIDLRGYGLLSELKPIRGARSRTQFFYLFTLAKKKRLTRANGRAHGLLTDGSAVVTHITFHHELEFGLHLRNAERASKHAVIASDAARFARRLHYAVFCSLDGIRRTDFSARRRIAVHADDRRCLNRMRAVNIFQMNHRMPSVRVAFAARLNASLTSYAPRRVYEKFHVPSNRHINLRLPFSP